jgi:hypothetical protein
MTEETKVEMTVIGDGHLHLTIDRPGHVRLCIPVDSEELADKIAIAAIRIGRAHWERTTTFSPGGGT